MRRQFKMKICLLNDQLWSPSKGNDIRKQGLGNNVMYRVSTEFRRHGIPSVFFTSVYSVFRAELAKIPAEFRRIPCRILP
jgi:hypothetical protein